MANMVLYGFNNLKDLASERVTPDLVPVIDSAIAQALQAHNDTLNALISLFVERTTRHTERYKTVGAARLQPLDDNGRALPIKPSGFYNVAYPLQQGGTAWGGNDVTIAKMTVEEVARQLDFLLMADIRWVRDHILAALFTNVTWTFPDDLEGDLTIQPLANGDAVTYQILSGGDLGGVDTHHIGQANAIGAGSDNPYPTLFTELMQHPENGGKALALIPSNVKAATEGLATFHAAADPNIRLGSGTAELIGTLGVDHPGTLLGYEDSGIWIAEWAFLPDNYIITVATEGPRTLAMREDQEEQLRGFKKVAERVDYPFWEAQYRRRAGFGVRNRVGSVIIEISDATYDIPTNYTSPMA